MSMNRKNNVKSSGLKIITLPSTRQFRPTFFCDRKTVQSGILEVLCRYRNGHLVVLFRRKCPPVVSPKSNPPPRAHLSNPYSPSPLDPWIQTAEWNNISKCYASHEQLLANLVHLLTIYNIITFKKDLTAIGSNCDSSIVSLSPHFSLKFSRSIADFAFKKIFWAFISTFEGPTRKVTSPNRSSWKTFGKHSALVLGVTTFSVWMELSGLPVRFRFVAAKCILHTIAKMDCDYKRATDFCFHENLEDMIAIGRRWCWKKSACDGVTHHKSKICYSRSVRPLSWKAATLLLLHGSQSAAGC